jgi:Arylsulfotransferase (ASST)
MIKRTCFLVLFSCSDQGASTSGELQSVSLSCETHPVNALRAVCTVESSPAGDVTLTWGPEGRATEQSKVLDGVSSELVTLLWFVPRTVHTITATPAAGSPVSVAFETATVPDELASTYTVDGTSTVRRVLHEPRCEDSSMVLISSTVGELLYYQELSPDDPTAEVQSVEMTPEGTFVAWGTGLQDSIGTPDEDWIREVDLEGNVLFEATHTVNYTEDLTHEVTKHNGYYYALFLERYKHEGLIYLLDGFYVLDPAGQVVATWRLIEHIDPEVLSGVGDPAVDFSHANSIFVDDLGNVLVSFRHLSALAYIAGDWTAPDFGEVLWWLAGDPDVPSAASDWSIVSSAGVPFGFNLQHHATFVAPDRIILFDNQASLKVDSRLMSIKLDAATGVADIDTVFFLERHCDYQGAHYTAANGNALATCSPSSLFYEFEPGAEDPRFKMTVGCFDGDVDAVFRFVPIDEPLIANGQLDPLPSSGGSPSR